MSVLAEFERALLRERVRSGIATSSSARRALELVAAGQSYRGLGISKNTVLAIVKRHRAEQAGP